MTERITLNEDLRDSVVPFPLPEGKRWKDYMWELTPVEQKSDGMYYKREDKFSLFGINTANGSKCRQLLHLFENRPTGADTVIHATNVNSSPQTIMAAAMAEHYGLRCIQVAGGTSFDAINKHQLPLFATMFGTKYEISSGSGFNVNIQKRVGEVMEKFPKSFTIERDITLDHRLSVNSAKMVTDFHKVGAHQVKNIPTFITDLIIPFGSANSATSILLGLSDDKDTPKALKRIHLINVGVDKRDYMFERLSLMGADTSMFEFIWHDTKQPYSKTIKGIQIDDITFHYRYEAKVYEYLLKNHPELINDKTLFWVVGSVPDLKTSAENLNRKMPTEVEIYEYEETFNFVGDIELDIVKKEVYAPNLYDDWFDTPVEKFDESFFEIIKKSEPTFMYVKGGNGAGKSTIPKQMLATDSLSYKIYSNYFKKTIFTVFPKYNFISLGNYGVESNFGGCDTLKKKEIMYAIEVLNRKEFSDFSVYLEGSIPSDTIAAYFDTLKNMTLRKPVVLFLSTSYEEALVRIKNRTGKSDEEMNQLKAVEKKYERLSTAKKVYQEHNDLGGNVVQLLELDTSGTIKEVFSRFVKGEFSQIGLSQTKE